MNDSANSALYCGAFHPEVSHLRTISVLLALLFSAAAHAAPTEIRFWHAMAGPLGDQVEAIAKEFNAAQKEYVVSTAYKGSYDETMAAAFIAQRAGDPPHLVQIYELGTANMMAAMKGTGGALAECGAGGAALALEVLRPRLVGDLGLLAAHGWC